MKFSVMRDEIFNALQRVVNVIPQRSTFMMTQNILLFIEDNLLKLIGTDLEITLMSWAPASITEEGSIAIPGRLLHDIVRELPNLELHFEADEQYRMKLTSDFGRYKISGVNPIEFPQRPELGEDVQEIVLENKIFKKLIDNTIFACSTDELRAALTGVFFNISSGEIEAVATDGHRLARMSYKNKSIPEKNIMAIVPTRSLNFVLRNLDGEGSSTIHFGKKHALFELSDTQLFARLIEETFVDFERVISNPLTSQVILNISPKHVELHAEDIDYGGEAQERIACEFNRDGLRIAFNSRYLQDILRHVSTDKLQLRFVRPDYAVLAIPMDMPKDEDQLMLLMPVRLESE